MPPIYTNVKISFNHIITETELQGTSSPSILKKKQCSKRVKTKKPKQDTFKYIFPYENDQENCMSVLTALADAAIFLGDSFPKSFGFLAQKTSVKTALEINEAFNKDKTSNKRILSAPKYLCVVSVENFPFHDHYFMINKLFQLVIAKQLSVHWPGSLKPALFIWLIVHNQYKHLSQVEVYFINEQSR